MRTFKEYICESRGFEWNGSFYQYIGWSRYRKDGSPITRDEYRAAAEERKSTLRPIKTTRGSLTAKNGYENERNVINSFKDKDLSKSIIDAMKIDTTKEINCIGVGGTAKNDCVVEYTDNDGNIVKSGISIKLVSATSGGYNQVYRGRIDNFFKIFDGSSPDVKEVKSVFNRFTGVERPSIDNTKSDKRMFMDEFSERERKMTLDFLNSNKTSIVSFVLAGDENYGTSTQKSAEERIPTDFFMTCYGMNGSRKVERMSDVIKQYENMEWEITPQGSLRIGNITLQRKGGDGGGEGAKDIQFKIKIDGLKE